MVGAAIGGVVGGLKVLGGATAATTGMAGVGAALVGGAKVASAAHSLYSLASSKKSAQKSQEAINRAQGGADLNEAIARDQFNWFVENIRPLQEQTIAQAASGALPTLQANRAAADVTRAYDSALGSSQRQASRVGVDLSSPRYLEVLKNMNLARAAAEAGLRTAGRQDAEAMNWNRKVQAAQFGRGMINQAQAGLMSAANFNQGVSQAYDRDTAAQAQLGATMLSRAGSGIQKFAGGFMDSYNRSEMSPGAQAEADYYG